MSDTKPIPVRLDHELIQRLDRAAERLGNTRTGVIKLCLSAFLDHFETTGAAPLPLNWREIVEFWDRRTRRSRSDEPKPLPLPEVDSAVAVMNEAASSKALEHPSSFEGKEAPGSSGDAVKSYSRKRKRK